jgi:hypothetical protein
MWSDFTSWFYAPFSQNMSVFQVAMTTGLVIIAAVFWFMILSKIREVV